MAYSIDTSALIHAWDNYPIKNMPKVWGYLKEQFECRNILLSEVAYEEINEGELLDWLDELALKPEEVNEKIQLIFEKLQLKLGIEEFEKDETKGINAEDLFIIAHASLTGRTLINQEAEQATKKDQKPKKRNYKIPLVCKDIANVESIEFIEIIKRSEQIF